MNTKKFFGSAGTLNQPSIDNSRMSDTGISDLVLEASNTKKRSMVDDEDLMKKRPCAESLDRTSGLPDVWPRFLVMSALDETKHVGRKNPFTIQKGFESIVGPTAEITPLRQGDILVKVFKKIHSQSLLNTKVFDGTPVKVSAHRSLNFKKGVIRCRHLELADENDILGDLKPQGVVEMKQISIKKAGKLVKTGTFILTFGLADLPKTVKVAIYNQIKVEPYVPNPLRCYRCQGFGHHQNNCRKKVICAKCGVGDHDEKDCKNVHKCANCGGGHPAFSRSCPNFELEKRILSIKTSCNLSYFEAKQRVCPTVDSTSRLVPSFADALVGRGPVVPSRTPILVEAGCQTKLTWPFNEENPHIYERDAVPKIDVRGAGGVMAASTQSDVSHLSMSDR